MAETADVIAALYDAAAVPSEWPSAFETLCRHLGAVGGVLGVLDPRLGDLPFSLNYGRWDDAAAKLYQSEYYKHDPAPARFAHRPVGVVASTKQFFRPEQEGEGIFYNEFLKPLGLVECMGAKLMEVPDGLAAIGVYRDATQPSFNALDMQRLEQLIPHIARALQLSRILLRANGEAAVLSAAVDRAPYGLLVIDGTGKVIHANRALHAMTARKDGLRLGQENILHFRDAPSDLRLQTLIHAVAKGQPGGIVSAPCEGSLRPYSVVVSPLPAGSGFPRADREPHLGVLVVVHDPSARTTPPSELLTETFGLTKHRAELVAALMAGNDLKGYAEQAHITIHTARFHLKSPFARMNVHNQAQLVSLAVTVLADLALR
jgi:DNA-binding CsgD family transcriptional regulator